MSALLLLPGFTGASTNLQPQAGCDAPHGALAHHQCRLLSANFSSLPEVQGRVEGAVAGAERGACGAASGRAACGAGEPRASEWASYCVPCMQQL